MSFLNSYFGYSNFADDSSHHGQDADNIHFIGIARKEPARDDEFVMMTSYSNTHSRSVDIRAVKNTFKNVSPDNYYTFDSAASWHILSDDLNLIYVLICKREYPQRCAYQCLQELQPVFRTAAGKKAFSSKEGGLNSAFKTQLSKICDKYEDTSSVDSLASTTKKVEGVKLVMQQNIELSLQNVVKLEEIQDRTEDLSKQASVFKKHGSQLRKNMYWRNIKMRFIFGAFVLVILGSIAGIIFYFVLKKKRESNNSSG